MANSAAMSTRTFVRRFRDATGTSPGTWLTQQRLMIARDLLETTSLSMDRIADAAGIGTATNLRLYFTSHVGVSPSIYRKQFRRETRPTRAALSFQPDQKPSPA
ncbi:helix-turn-helix protein [Sphingomonas faeni]|uniref:Helix-turn-helix protein n=2 Tax=Sphingomonas faeni TaxID=185950 RepID=A0A2T5TVZ0_9SPHN|nr:helix-turn-helix protein [Sphingomonas faeni]